MPSVYFNAYGPLAANQTMELVSAAHPEWLSVQVSLMSGFGGNVRFSPKQDELARGGGGLVFSSGNSPFKLPPGVGLYARSDTALTLNGQFWAFAWEENQQPNAAEIADAIAERLAPLFAAIGASAPPAAGGGAKAALPAAAQAASVARSGAAAWVGALVGTALHPDEAWPAPVFQIFGQPV